LAQVIQAEFSTRKHASYFPPESGAQVLAAALAAEMQLLYVLEHVPLHP